MVAAAANGAEVKSFDRSYLKRLLLGDATLVGFGAGSRAKANLPTFFKAGLGSGGWRASADGCGRGSG